MTIYEMPGSGAGSPAKGEGKNFEPGNERMEREKEEIRKRKIILAKEFIERGERFSFPGINPHSYAKLKADEDEFPGFATPIDELIQRLKDEGMKVVFGNDPENGDIFVLPFGSDDIENDSVFPKHLQTSESMSEKLQELILLGRS